MFALRLGEVSAQAGRTPALTCRNTIARNAREFVRTGLSALDACHRRQDARRSPRECNALSSLPEVAVAHGRADAIIAAECERATRIFANYPRASRASDIGGVLLAALQKTLEESGSGLQGLPSSSGGQLSARARIKCRRSIGRARTAIVTSLLARATRCQRARDKATGSFAAIEDQCLDVPPPRNAARQRSAIVRACAGVSGSDVGSCSPLPDCVVAQAVLTGRTLADDTYGAPPEVRAMRCGNGILDLGEFCDDGNRVPTDACTDQCLPARCGDGLVETGVEECDDANNVETDACTHLCKLARCGDGIVEAGVEECDDGASMPNVDCADCHRPAVRCTDMGVDAIESLVAQLGTPSDLAGVRVELSYSMPLGIPGSGGDPSVRARVTDLTGAGGFPGVNDSDSNGDGVDDTLVYLYAVADAIPLGPLVKVRFDCPAGTMVFPAELPCNIGDASDSFGNSLDPSVWPRCTLTLAAPRNP